MKRKTLTRVCSVLLCICMAIGLAAPAFAAEVADATIDTSKTASLTIFKYDFTNAAKDGVWSVDSYVSTGQYDANVNTILGAGTRKGDTDSTSELGNGDTSNGYAIKGVEYTYLKVAEPYQYGGLSDSTTFSYNGVKLPVLPEWDKTQYPYAVITKCNPIPASGATYMLYLSKDKCVANATGTGTGGGISQVYLYVPGNTEWTEGFAVNMYLGDVNTNGEIIWCNKEITYRSTIENIGSTTYLAASDPVSNSVSTTEVLYKFDKTKAANLLTAIGLPNGQGSHEKANALDDTAWFYQSDVISKALSDALIANPTTTKNALETYIKANGGTAMDETNENGMSKAENLPLGLYLLVETKVPEMVTETTNPFFVALPMTNVNGGGDGSTGNDTQITDGGHAWLYDVTIYPKNETGIVTLEKTVGESPKDTGAIGSTTTSVSCSYNGVELPDINTVWTDKEAYPYAYICSKKVLELTYTLVLSDTPLCAEKRRVSDYYVVDLMNTVSPVQYATYRIGMGYSYEVNGTEHSKEPDKEWTGGEETGFSNYGDVLFAVDFVWSNTNVMLSSVYGNDRDVYTPPPLSDEVYLSASDPISVSSSNSSAVYAHNASASTGDTVEYQIISTLPTITSASTYLSEYTFQDVLSSGLSYADQDPMIQWYTDPDCTDLVSEWKEGDGNFSVSRENNKMTIAMTEAGLAKINTTANNANGSIYSGYSNYTMRITYSATLNPDASMVYGDAGNSNKVVLTWKRTSSEYYDTLIDDCHVYTYGINLTKKFSDGKEDQALFDEVLFKIQNKTDGYYVKAQLNESEGIWYVTGHTENEAEATAIHPVAWKEKPGQIVVKGLENDVYILTEIETANSYTLLKDAINVTIKATEDASRPCDIYSEDALGVIQNDPRFNFDGGMDLTLSNIPQSAMAHNMLTASATVDGNAVKMLADEADTYSAHALAPLTVTNTHGFNLPQTGETGAKWLPIVGGMIIGLSLLGFFYCMMPKHKNEEQ